jgi:hypothetical protein
MAEAAVVSVSSVRRIWRAHGLQPHRVRHFRLSNDPAFVDKLRDIVGLYVDPPEHAAVLFGDEKSQIQAGRAGLGRASLRAELLHGQRYDELGHFVSLTSTNRLRPAA